MNTIKSKKEIETLFLNGNRLYTPYLTFIVGHTAQKELNHVLSEHDHKGRVAFIAGKKNGNAVWRNSAKRRMRAICKDLGGPWNNYNIIFLAKHSIMNVSYQKVLYTCKNKKELSFLYDKGE